MSDCNSCVHKRDRCFCPPNMNCTAYKKEKHKVKHFFEFETNDDWVPGDSACWAECPFSALIPLGQTCRFLTIDDIHCPFIKNRSYYIGKSESMDDNTNRLTDDELWAKCQQGGSITPQDLGIESNDC